MAWTPADLDTLNAAITSGIRSVTFADGRKTEYQNLSDMLAAREVMVADLATTAGTSSRRNRFIVGRVGRL